MTAAEALQAAVYARLAADPALAVLVEGRISDSARRGVATPYLAIGDWRATPVGSSDGDIVEHRFELVAVTREGGRREAVGAAGRAAAVLASEPPAPEGHRLVGLALLGTRSAPTRDRRAFEASASFRAVTEAEA
jgi:hypothetical protein